MTRTSQNTTDTTAGTEADVATGTETTQPEYRPTLKDVSHTHPDTDEAFGTAMAYKRGPVVAADGGERDGVEGTAVEDDAESPETSGERMRDVDHAPPDGDDVNRVHERGGEGRTER